MTTSLTNNGVLLPDGTTQRTAPNATISVFTSPGTWTFTQPSNLKYIKVTVVGGGGGGGGARGVAPPAPNNYGAGGGGGGGTSIVFVPASPFWVGNSVVDVTIGAGGNGGTAPSTDAAGTNGVSGGVSSFGSIASASGGIRAAPSGRPGGDGGIGTTDKTTLLNNAIAAGAPELDRRYEVINISGSGGSGANIMPTGDEGAAGGDTTHGAGGRGVYGSAAGQPARQYGGGGGGAHAPNQTGRAGGNGAPGIVIIEEFY